MINPLYLRKKEHILDLIWPYLLVVVLMLATYSVYRVSVFSVWGPGAALLAAVLFAVCAFVERHRILGGAVITLVSLGAIVAYNRLSWGNDWGMSFRQWFLSGADEAETLPRYLLALLVGFTTFFSLTIYYFGKVLYRISFITLVSLIPCVVYVKVVAQISNVYVVLIAMLNLFIFIHHKRKENAPMLVVGGRAHAIIVMGFALLLFFVTAAIPKESRARFYDYFENLFMGADTSAVLSEDYSGLNEYSGNADFFGDYSNRLMYTITGGDGAYMKKQTFDYYDFDNDRWYKNSYYSETTYDADDWYGLKGDANLYELQLAVRCADTYSPGFALKYGLLELVTGGDISDSTDTMTVHAENFGAGYYIVPSRVLSVDVYTTGEDYRITRMGTFASTVGLHSSNVTYRVKYYEEIASRISFIEAGGANMDNETAAAMLEELEEILEESGNADLAETARAFLALQNEADDYRAACLINDSLISEELKNEAARLTEGLSTDWEKAYALQSYFLSGEFTYDLKYKAPDNSPEYFIFTGKTGTCSDFASAYVLLARAAGLAVRYVEGYAPEESEGFDGVYEIYDRDSHAYPEVFIQNMGWLVFDPTASSPYSGEETKEADQTQFTLPTIEMDYGLMLVIFLLAGAVSIVILVAAVAVPLVGEGIFLLGMRSGGDERSVLQLYRRLKKKAAALSGARYGVVNAMTPREFGAWFVESFGIDVGDLVALVEKCGFAGGTITPDELDTALEVYRQGKRAMKKGRRRRKSPAEQGLKGISGGANDE